MQSLVECLSVGVAYTRRSMYTIRKRSRERLTIPVPRAWERRYGWSRRRGRLAAPRLRRAALDRLRAMRRLIARPVGERSRRRGRAGTVETMPGPRAAQVGRTSVIDYVDRLVSGGSPTLADRGGPTTCSRAAPTSEWSRITSCRHFGRSGTRGRRSASGRRRHVASNAIQRRLAGAFQASGPGPAVRPSSSMPPGARARWADLRDGRPVAAGCRSSPWRRPPAGRLDRRGRADERQAAIGALMNADRAAQIRRTGLRAATQSWSRLGGAAAPEPSGLAAAAAGLSSARTIRPREWPPRAGARAEAPPRRRD